MAVVGRPPVLRRGHQREDVRFHGLQVEALERLGVVEPLAHGIGRGRVLVEDRQVQPVRPPELVRHAPDNGVPADPAAHRALTYGVHAHSNRGLRCRGAGEMGSRCSSVQSTRNHIPVFPCRPDKSPYTDHGFKDASTDLRMVRRLFGPRPDALIGVPTGHRFDVLDIDVKHFEAVEWLKACRAGDPAQPHPSHPQRRAALSVQAQPAISQHHLQDRARRRYEGEGRVHHLVAV